ncbi:GATA transcription factor 8 [Acorus calamus]|uniref:GATA transcription factor 8 n=1 Tax=Acorus calamus TaxID=4465 RepID=A0AAV9C4B2_ACOCL|nr:GATA transcription factor 8 [Acorus calamus]
MNTSEASETFGDFDVYDLLNIKEEDIPKLFHENQKEDDSTTLISDNVCDVDFFPKLDDINDVWFSKFIEESYAAPSSMNVEAIDPNTNSHNNSMSNCNTDMNNNSSQSSMGSSSNNNNNFNHKDSPKFHTPSPDSVLDPDYILEAGPYYSSSSSTSTSPSYPPKAIQFCPETVLVPGRARTKRPRPQAFTPRPVAAQVSPASSTSTNASPIEFKEVELFQDIPIKVQKKPKKPKAGRALDEEGREKAKPVRKCLHCEIEKTPQWRAGPMGPKTLCNACGVRYKSGRLFPEYRPAASPTFVSSIHSNSHKKVVEMRNRAGLVRPGPPPEFEGRERVYVK